MYYVRDATADLKLPSSDDLAAKKGTKNKAVISDFGLETPCGSCYHTPVWVIVSSRKQVIFNYF
jgi:hypothetical protein